MDQAPPQRSRDVDGDPRTAAKSRCRPARDPRKRRLWLCGHALSVSSACRLCRGGFPLLAFPQREAQMLRRAFLSLIRVLLLGAAARAASFIYQPNDTRGLLPSSCEKEAIRQ